MTYEELVKKVDSEWNSLHEKEKDCRIKCEWNPDGKVPWNWKENIHEINLWNYWQGNITHKADIMLVGQDWGNPHEMESSILLENILYGRNYLDNQKKIYETDKSLIELFAELKKAGETLFPDIKNQKYNNLFFTNFYLGYRLGKTTGGMTKKQMMLDAPYFQILSEIVKPKILIALGKDTYECVVSALKKTNFRYKNPKLFWEELNNGRNYQYVEIDGQKAVVVGVAHCGFMGVNINRKKYSASKPEVDGLTLMRQDWQNINRFIDELL